eukprot:CAMPEP_0195290204 /NCGR_PEP_ID=MMETSP0707-20130614/6160_1 /TAXON_ID=33640 /ORGANISM="Asterionellopsis glacialis, Strain CCMP134" /LENGTH=505 /DNA_ID=CAMNT_0040350299 /DNA_START=195 /DNA_END=1709 /DNA_ORIENTATION=+
MRQAIYFVVIWTFSWPFAAAFVGSTCGKYFVQGKSKPTSYHHSTTPALWCNRVATREESCTPASYWIAHLEPISDSSDSGNILLGNGIDFPSEDDLAQLPNGQKGGYKVIRQFQVPIVDNSNMTLQSALVLLDPENYPSLTRARKACRKGDVLLHRGPINISSDEKRTSTPESPNITIQSFGSTNQKCQRGRVGDVVFPGDVIAIQGMMGSFKKKRCYPFIQYSRPRFALPVLFEDDYMAIVDKPAGISMYGQRQSKSGSLSRRTIRDMLPYCLTPPKRGTPGQILKRPMAVHRLDTPTSGLLVVAKTKDAMDSLYEQFQQRIVTKTYTAIVNGIPSNCDDKLDLITPENDRHVNWNIVDYPLGGKYAITKWRILRSVRSLNAKDGTLTMVEVQPRTGRYHQIRRHMAWVCRRPLAGDDLYAGALQASKFRRNGLYLCSNGIALDHPYYNTQKGRQIWDEMKKSNRNPMIMNSSSSASDESIIRVTVKKELPKRFGKLMDGEESW